VPILLSLIFSAYGSTLAQSNDSSLFSEEEFALGNLHEPGFTLVKAFSQSILAMSWEQDKTYLVIIFIAIIVEAVLIVSLWLLHTRRRTAERERERFARLALSEHRHLNEVISNVPGIVWETLIDPTSKQRTTTFISDYVEKMVGYSPQEWLASPGFGFRLMLTDDDRKRVEHDSNEVIRTGKARSTQFRWKTKDGRIIWVETHLSPELDDEGQTIGLRGVTLEITERKKTEGALEQTEENNRAILNAIPDLMFLQTHDGVYLDYHVQNPRDLPFPQDNLIGKNMRDVLPAELAENFFASFERAAELGEPQLLEYMLPIEGTDRWFEARIAPSGPNFLTVVRDVTGRKLGVDELRHSEERFSKAFKANPQPMSITKVANGVYVDVNESFVTMSGYSREEIIGHTSLELNIWETPEARVRFVEQLKQEGSLVNVETRFRTKQGSIRVLLSSAEQLELGGEQCLIMASSDITERTELEESLHKTLEELSKVKNQLEAENIYLQQELQLDQTFGEIVGHSDAVKYVLAKISQVAPTDSTVLITGETGTGKELVARAIHGASMRKNRPLIKVNCAALSRHLIESELFGHEKGAFTGAIARKLGRFELADGGTIFLDEIGELSLEMQTKLLRVLQEGEFERVGGTKTIKVDVRVISATNKNLKVGAEQGTFREDLWYRLNVFPITVPALKQRKEDIPLLVEHFVRKAARKFGKTITSVSPRSMHGLQSYGWPGNVRELANVIERGVIHTKGSVLQLVDNFEQVREEAPTPKSLEEMEREHIIRTLDDSGWRIEGPYGAAKVLGLNPSTLRARLAKLGIQRPRATSV
jgi:PAS domain S-box-containing protein